MSEGKAIHELVGYWLEYAEKRSDSSLLAFSKWLQNRLKPINADQNKMETNIENVRLEIGQVFGRLINYTENWGKLAFKDLPIRQFEDFGILMTVQHIGNPSKNELANLLIIEKSTVFEIIKRLVRDGLLKESIDQDDKRIRRVSLTKEGGKIAEKARQQAMKVSVLLMGDSNDEEIYTFLEKFKELDRFHELKYAQKGVSSIDDLLD